MGSRIVRSPAQHALKPFCRAFVCHGGVPAIGVFLKAARSERLRRPSSGPTSGTDPKSIQQKDNIGRRSRPAAEATASADAKAGQLRLTTFGPPETIVP